MNIFSTPEFKKEFDKLIRKNSYKYLTNEIISTYLDKKTIDLSGVRLNGHSKNPYIKKRLGGDGGARLYLLAVINKDSIYLSFIHPKTGTYGYSNITKEKRIQILADTIECIKSNNLYEVSCSEKRDILIFKKINVKK